MNDNPEIGRCVEAGGISTNVHLQGTGPEVLLLHGSGAGVSAWANWKLTIPALAKRFRVIAPDVLGFGYTSVPAETRFRLDVWCGHILDLLDTLGVARTHVVGNSFGGALALALAIRAPERVDRMVLMGSAGIEFELTDALDQVWTYPTSREEMGSLLRQLTANPDLVSDELVALRYRASRRPEVQAIFPRLFPSPRQQGIRLLASGEEAIRAIRRESLIIHGREDQVVPPEVGYRLFRLLPNSRLYMFSRCGHWAHFEHAEVFHLLLLKFLSGAL